MQKLSKYWPLFSLLIAALLGATVITQHNHALGQHIWMHNFMGLFLLIFGLLKIFNVPDFVNGFIKYDLLAKLFKPYAYLYPFIEFGLGLVYLGFYYPQITYTITCIVMLVNFISVVIALRGGLNINCPCMGSILKVPLSTVTLTEDAIMFVMALLLLIHF